MRNLVILACLAFAAAGCGGWSQVAKMTGDGAGPELSRSGDFTIDGPVRVTIKSSGSVLAYLMPEGVPDSWYAWQAWGRKVDPSAGGTVDIGAGGTVTLDGLDGSYHLSLSCDPVPWSVTVWEKR